MLKKHLFKLMVAVSLASAGTLTSASPATAYDTDDDSDASGGVTLVPQCSPRPTRLSQFEAATEAVVVV